MFGLFSKKDETKTTLQATDPQAENIPIHTMTRDLESLSQPEKEDGKHLLGNIFKPEPETKSKGLSELQKNSPFLNRQPISNLPPPPIPKPKVESFAKPVSDSSPSLPPPPIPKPRIENFAKPVSEPLPSVPSPPIPKPKMENFAKPVYEPLPSAPPIPAKPKMESFAKPIPESLPSVPPPPIPKPRIENFAKPVSEPLPSTPPLPIPKPKRQGFTKPVSDFLFKDSSSSEPKTRVDIGADKNASNKDERKKLVAILIIILLITATASGGYYFWSTRKSALQENAPVQEIVNDPIPETTPDLEEAIPEEQPAPAFSATEKNYLMIESGSNSLISFKGMIQSYYEKIVASKISYPVEFTIINAENSPLDFRKFAQALNIKFSPEMMSAIDNSFNLFIYDDHGSPGIGLSIKVKGKMNPEDTLLKEEVNLPREIQSIFPVSQFTIENGKAFTTSEYSSSRWGKIGIRFQNIISPQNLSVDYSFVNTGTDMLFIGTTRDTLRSIVDETEPFITVP